MNFSTKVALIYMSRYDAILSTHPYTVLDNQEQYKDMIGEVRIDVMENAIHTGDLMKIVYKYPQRLTAISKWADSYVLPDFTYWERI